MTNLSDREKFSLSISYSQSVMCLSWMYRRCVLMYLVFVRQLECRFQVHKVSGLCKSRLQRVMARAEALAHYVTVELPTETSWTHVNMPMNGLWGATTGNTVTTCCRTWLENCFPILLSLSWFSH